MKYFKFNSVNFCKVNFSKLIDKKVDRFSENFVKNQQLIIKLSEKINNVKLKFCEGGGERAKIKHVQQNKKMLVEDRLRVLFDGGKYFELGTFVGYGQNYGDIAKAGCVTALGRINDRLCTVAASDATVKGGTVYPIQLRKQLRIQNWAMNMRLPFIFIVDSGGAYLPLQAEIFPDKNHGGRTFYNQAVMQSKGIPAISLVCGSCTAGAAYIPTMCSEMGMVSKTSHIFLGGPPLVKAAIGEIIDAENLGGAFMHGNISGCSDHSYDSELEGLESIRFMISTLPNQSFLDINVINSVDPLYHCEELSGLVINASTKSDQRRVIIEQILARILDESSIHEFKADFGTGLVTGFGRISGNMVGILAGYDRFTDKDCLKGSHFLQMCGHRNIPIVNLVHTMDELVGSEVKERSKDYAAILLKDKSSFLRAVATRCTKMITVIIGDAVGMDYLCLGGQPMDPDFIFAWPNARFGFDGCDLEALENCSILKAAGNMVVDDIIEPKDTRRVVTDYLKMLNTESNLPLGIIPEPVFRL